MVAGIFLRSFFVVFALYCLMALGTRDAYAQGTVNSCTNSSYSYNSACSSSSISSGTVVVSGGTAIAAANATAGLVLNRVSAFRASSSAPGQTASGTGTINLLGFGSGAAAGEASSNRMGLWVNGARSRIVGTETGGDFDSDLISGMVGLDVRPSKEILFGISGGYEKTDTDTGYNRGTVNAKGRTAAGYLSLKVNKNVSLDAIGGHTWLDYDNARLDPLSSATISGTTDATRVFGSANLAGTWDLKSVIFGAKVGSMYVKEEVDAFTETGGSNSVSVASQSTTIGTANTGIRFTGNHDTAKPYVEGTYAYEYNGAGGGLYSSKHNYGGAVGLDLKLGDGLTANLEGRGVFKEHLKTGTGSIMLRYQTDF